MMLFSLLRRGWRPGPRLIRIGVIALIVVAIGLVVNLFIPSPYITYAGTFTPTGPMRVARDGATATLLADGRVLVAGGATSDGTGSTILGSAEVYDPKAGSFTTTGSLLTPRADALATLLADGRVLVVGGRGSGPAGAEALTSAELYDPRSGTFTGTGSLPGPHLLGSSTLLADGRVLIVGGHDDQTGLELKTAEVFDPGTGTFTTTGSMSTGRDDAATALLPDGRVLVAGGAISGNASTDTETASAELYDPATGSFSPTGSMAVALEGRSATLLISGKILIAGGRGDGGLALGSVSAELYDPPSGTFAVTGSLHTPRVSPTAIGLVDGRVLVAGGPDPAELYDPVYGVFSQAGAMTQPRHGGTATILDDGRVLFSGGVIGAQTIASAELFH